MDAGHFPTLSSSTTDSSGLTSKDLTIQCLRASEIPPFAPAALSCHCMSAVAVLKTRERGRKKIKWLPNAEKPGARSQETSKTAPETAQRKTMRLHSCYWLMRKAVNSTQKPQFVLFRQDLISKIYAEKITKMLLGSPGKKKIYIWIMFQSSTEHTRCQHRERCT